MASNSTNISTSGAGNTSRSANSTSQAGPIQTPQPAAVVQPPTQSSTSTIPPQQATQPGHPVQIVLRPASPLHRPDPIPPPRGQHIPQIRSSGDALSGVYGKIFFERAVGHYSKESGIRVKDWLAGEVALLRAEDKVLAGTPYRRIKIKILWPGYSEVYTKSIGTENRNITRAALLTLVVDAICQFSKSITRSRVAPEAGYERWLIGQRADGAGGIDCMDIVVGSLVHRQGSDFQPEFYL